MMRWLSVISVSVAVLFAGLLVLPTYEASAIVDDVCRYDTTASDICAKQTSDDPKPVFVAIINFLLWLSVIAAVVVIVVSGIKFTTSGGDASKVASAKKTLLGAVLGILVSVLALVLVNFAVGLVNK